MHIEIIGTLDRSLVAILGTTPRVFYGMERLVIVDLRKGITSRSKPFDSVMSHALGGIRLNVEIPEEDRAAAIELARKQFELEGYGPEDERTAENSRWR